MASAQAVSSSATAAAAVGSGTASTIGETVARSFLFKIDDLSETEDLGVGKSIKSATFQVGRHGWYLECYPCGKDADSAGRINLSLCLSSLHEDVAVEAECGFTLMDLHPPRVFLYDRAHKFNASTLWRWDFDFLEREELESILREDCLQIRCYVSVYGKKFSTVDLLHRPPVVSDIVATSRMHRGLLPAGPSAPPRSGAAAGSAAKLSDENVTVSHVLTIDGYSRAKKTAHGSLESGLFDAVGHSWFIGLHPKQGGSEEKDIDCLAIHLCNNDVHGDGVVKVRFELTLLTVDREIIWSAQFCYAFSKTNYKHDGHIACKVEPLPEDTLHVKCDITVVKDITPMRPPDLHRHFGDLLASKVGADVTFDVGGDLFTAHKIVLATRSSAFMAAFFGHAKDTATPVLINDMEPRVFKALLHFIYTDTLPDDEVHGDDKVVMAQGLLVAADRYAMERLKLICADMLCSYLNDGCTAFTTLELAVKHGCHRLREACFRFLKGHFANVVDP